MFLRSVAVRSVALRAVALWCAEFRCVAFRSAALRFVTFRCVTLRCVVHEDSYSVQGGRCALWYVSEVRGNSSNTAEERYGCNSHTASGLKGTFNGYWESIRLRIRELLLVAWRREEGEGISSDQKPLHAIWQWTLQQAYFIRRNFQFMLTFNDTVSGLG
jgi:hypothetical protein